MTESVAINAFLRRAFGDLDALGRLESIEVYLAAFPGYEAEITREYRCLIEAEIGAVPGGFTDPVEALAWTACAEADLDAVRDRDRIGPYRVLSEIGRGGQARVLLAEDTRCGRRVALKVLPVGASDVEIGRLRREGETVCRLDDPHVCDVYEVGEYELGGFIAMKLVDGETLATRIAAARGLAPIALTEADRDRSAEERMIQVLAFVETIARSTHALHTAGVLHRDLKPANLMVTPSGAPMILDFGLVRTSDASGARLTGTGDVLGTPAYMAPEQLGAHPGCADVQTDVWSLGVVLWECLTGVRPFAAADRQQLVRRIRRGALPELPRSSALASRELGTLLGAALEPSTTRRYASALAFAEDLACVRLGRPISVRPTGWLRRLRRLR